METSYSSIYFGLDSGDLLLIDLVYFHNKKKRILSLAFLVEINRVEVNLQNFGDSLTKILLKERLLPFLHQTVYFTKMVIKIQPNDKSSKTGKEPRSSLTFLYLLSKNMTGYIKEGQVEDNIFGVFELQKGTSMNTVYKYLAGVPVFKSSSKEKTNDLVSPFANCSREVTLVESLFCGVLILNLGQEIQLRPMFVCNGAKISKDKIVSISSCSYRGLKTIKTRGPNKAKVKSSENSSKKGSKSST